MKSVGKCCILGLLGLAFVANANAQAAPVAADIAVVTEFEQRVRDYSKQREDIEEKMPRLSKEATAAEITAHKKALLKNVLAARRSSRRGNAFTPEGERVIRSIIAAQYKGRDRAELRRELAEAENKTVPVKVNAVYPEAAELLEMPPSLLLALPKLPKQVRYRFVGSNLLLEPAA